MAAGKMPDTVIDSSCFDTPIVTGCLSGRIRTASHRWRVDILQIDSFYVTCLWDVSVMAERTLSQYVVRRGLKVRLFGYERKSFCMNNNFWAVFFVRLKRNAVALLWKECICWNKWRVLQQRSALLEKETGGLLGDFRAVLIWSPSGLCSGSRDMFNIQYMLPLGQIRRYNGITYHFYADDIQLYSYVKVGDADQFILGVCLDLLLVKP